MIASSARPGSSSFDRPECHRFLVFDEDPISGKDWIGVRSLFGHFVAGDLAEFFRARLDNDQLAAGVQHHYQATRGDDGTKAGSRSTAASTSPATFAATLLLVLLLPARLDPGRAVQGGRGVLFL